MTPESKLVQLKRGTGSDRILVVPGLGGSPLSFVRLARAYPGPEGIGVLVAPAEAAGGPLSIGALASCHLQAACSLGTASRWHLAGHSFGACVAMEMARQAARSGGRLGTVALLWPLLRLGGELEAAERAAAEARLRAADRLRARLYAAAGPALVEDDPEVGRDLADLDLDPALLRSGVDFAVELLTHAAFALRAYLDHRQEPVPARVDVLTGAPDHAAERRLRELTAGVAVHEVACAPADVLRPPCASLVARTLASLIASGA